MQRLSGPSVDDPRQREQLSLAGGMAAALGMRPVGPTRPTRKPQVMSRVTMSPLTVAPFDLVESMWPFRASAEPRSAQTHNDSPDCYGTAARIASRGFPAGDGLALRRCPGHDAGDLDEPPDDGRPGAESPGAEDPAVRPLMGSDGVRLPAPRSVVSALPRQPPLGRGRPRSARARRRMPFLESPAATSGRPRWPFELDFRTREIGVRLALGTTAGGVRWLVLRQASPWWSPAWCSGCRRRLPPPDCSAACS